MTTKPVDEGQMRARAIARWEGEGGALSTPSESDAIDETALRILARLGASVLEAWESVPATLQSELVRRARTLGAPGDRVRIRDALSQFLQEHRNDC